MFCYAPGKPEQDVAKYLCQDSDTHFTERVNFELKFSSDIG